MSGIPFYNSDHIILQAAHEILSDQAQTLDLITLINERFNADITLNPLLAVSVESMIAADDAPQPPQQPVSVRLDLLGNKLLKRGVGLGVGRSVFRLQVRVLLRTTTLVDGEQNPALAGKGYSNTTQHQAITRLRNAVDYALQRRLLGFRIADPDGGDPLCTGIYNIEGPIYGPIDRPITGDQSLLRATLEYDVFIKVRSGVGTTSPV